MPQVQGSRSAPPILTGKLIYSIYGTNSVWKPVDLATQSRCTIEFFSAPPLQTTASQTSSSRNRSVAILVEAAEIGGHHLAARLATLPLGDFSNQITEMRYHTPGGLSDVYVGILSTRKVAVKVPRHDQSEGLSFASAAMGAIHEMKIHRRLHRNNIVPFLGYTFDFGPMVSFIFPWYDRGTLHDCVKHRRDRPGLSKKERFSLLIDVVDAVQYLHSLGIIHNDIKGVNVLIADDGHACLNDFGSAVDLADIANGSFDPSSIHLTLRYAAPEILPLDESDAPPVFSPASDVFSIGRLMLEALTGRLPYYRRPLESQVFMALVQGQLPELPTEPRIDGEHWTFMRECWEMDPAHRPDMHMVLAQMREFHARA